jgi:hypothetical protein
VLANAYYAVISLVRWLGVRKHDLSKRETDDLLRVFRAPIVEMLGEDVDRFLRRPR